MIWAMTIGFNHRDTPLCARRGLYLRNILVQPLGKHLQQLTPIRVPVNEGRREPEHRRKDRVDDIDSR
jgi:hypothetical protein